jgi:hypothetical protein
LGLNEVLDQERLRSIAAQKFLVALFLAFLPILFYINKFSYGYDIAPLGPVGRESGT